MKLRNKLFPWTCAVGLLVSSAGAIGQAIPDFKLVVKPRHMYDDPLQTVVNYGDLNLARSQGVAVLYRRLENAVQYVCSPHTGRSIGQRPIFLRCTDESMTAAVRAVNNAKLTELYAARSESAQKLTAQVRR